MHSWQQSRKHKARTGRRTGGPTHPSIHPSICNLPASSQQQPYKVARRGEDRRRRISHSCAASVCLCACDAGQQRAVYEGPPRELRRRRPLRRLPLLHGLHVAVRRVCRRPQREEGAGAGPGGPLLLLFCSRRHDRHHGGPGRFIRRRHRRRGREGGGDAGARGGRGVEADEGDPEPVADVRGVRRRGGRGRGAGDGDRVPHGRAARGAHRLGRPQQHGGRRRRHGEHGERLLAALLPLPLPPPPRHGHGPRLRLNLTASSSDEGYLVPPPPPAGTVVVDSSWLVEFSTDCVGFG